MCDKMPSPNAMRSKRVAHVHVEGVVWMGYKAVTTLRLRDYDLENIGTFDREHVQGWLDKNAGDFQRIIDFECRVGDAVIPWEDEDNMLTFSDAMYPE